LLYKPLDNWTSTDRVYKSPFTTRIYQKEVISMVDLTNKTIRKIFERQIRELTLRTIIAKEDSFDLQLSGGWLR